MPKTCCWNITFELLWYSSKIYIIILLFLCLWKILMINKIQLYFWMSLFLFAYQCCGLTLHRISLISPFTILCIKDCWLNHYLLLIYQNCQLFPNLQLITDQSKFCLSLYKIWRENLNSSYNSSSKNHGIKLFASKLFLYNFLYF